MTAQSAAGCMTSLPTKPASPKVKTLPSAAVSQYPRPLGVAAIPMIGAAGGWAPNDPQNPASPNVNTPPSDAAASSLAARRRRHADDRLVQSDRPVDPKNPASPNVKMPPSPATSQ